MSYIAPFSKENLMTISEEELFNYENAKTDAEAEELVGEMRSKREGRFPSDWCKVFLSTGLYYHLANKRALRKLLCGKLEKVSTHSREEIWEMGFEELNRHLNDDC